MLFWICYIECKLHHNERMEDIWIRREVGDDLWYTMNQDWCNIVKRQKVPNSLPSDVFKGVDVYLEIEDSKRSSWFALAYPAVVKAKEKQW